ncbi:MAG: hypothetical protein CSA68_10415 [Rhodobacterales bacterium]|nr:MAG: hypothetical protein CSA68_10415 [Rhodobacterales bacterium]
MTHQHHKKDSGAVERRCIATGATAPKAGMIRFVVGPDGWLVPDVLQKLPGRGIWVSADRAALQKAVKKGLFARAAKQPVTLPDDLIGLTEAALAKRLIELISLARKAGLAVTGYEKVKSWLISERARVLLQARDGSERGKSRLRAPGGPDGFIGILTGQELGLAFGRENVIHGALAAGGLTKRVVEEAAM